MDFEDAQYDVNICQFDLWLIYNIWDLVSKEVRAGEKYNDPMIPTLHEFHSKTYVDSDEALLALAARKTRGGP